MAQDSLTSRIQRQLPPEREPRITAAETDDAVILSGTVPSHEERAAAERAAAALAPGKRIENLLEVERVLPEDRIEHWDDANEEPLFEDTDGAQVGDADNPNLEFTGQPLNTDVLAVEDAGVEEDTPGTFTEQDPTFYAPTDPVITSDQQGNLEVLGGFSPGAMDGMTVDASAEDNTPGDEALVDAITRELREDALTTTLGIDVVVERGIVRLRGHVPALEDAEAAEEVASRVPGVREVNEELDVEQL